MHHLRWVIVAIATMILPAATQNAGAEDRLPINPQGQVQDQRLPAGQFDPGPCAGELEILNQYGTCTPCLANSVAGRGNQLCVCSPGFVETARNQWHQATCVAAAEVPAPAAPQVVEITVPAGTFFFYAEQQGFGSRALRWAGSPVALCGAQRRGDVIYAEYNAGTLGQLLPPQLPPSDVVDYSCDIDLLGAQLNNGWELVRLQNIDDSDCRGDYYGYTLTRRSSDLANTAHDLRLTAWGSAAPNHGFCIIHIREAVMRGPASGKWEDAFGG